MKSKQGKIRVIDNSIHEQMEYLDRRDDNYFSNEYSLITNLKIYTGLILLNHPLISSAPLLILVKKGYTKITIAFNEYTLFENHLILIPNNVIFTIYEQTDNYETTSLFISFPEIRKTELLDYKETHLILSKRERQDLDGYLNLLDILSHRNYGSRDGIKYLLLSLLHHIDSIKGNNGRKIESISSDKSSLILNQFRQLLTSQKYPSRQPDYYADKLSVTKGHLSYIIKKQTGKTLMNWVNERVVIVAQALLLSTKESIDSIALNLHFSDAPQFIKYFTKHTGETPGKYRKRALRNFNPVHPL